MRALNFVDASRILENAVAFQSVPDTVSVEIRYLYNGVPVENTFYGKLSGYTQADLQQLADDIDAYWGPGIQGAQTGAAAYVETFVKGLEFINDITAVQDASAGNGSLGGGVLPNNVTKAITLRSNFTGRSARGRIFWIGVGVGQLDADENFLLSTAVATMVASTDAIRAVFTGAGFVPVIVSRFSGGVQRATGVTFNWTSTGNSDLTTDSMRGRLPKV